MNARLDPELLSTFLAVVHHGRISAAARAIHLSQPAVTARIRKLEARIGAPLLVRSVRGVEATAHGSRLAEHARELERLLDRALDDVAATENELGSLALAASTTIAAHVLPPVLARFRARHPDLPIAVEIGNTQEVVTAVREGSMPLGLVEGTAKAVGVRLVPWLDDELVPVISPTAAFSVKRDGDLDRVPLLWRETGSGTRAVIATALRKAGIRSSPDRSDLVLGTNTAIAHAAAAGLGVAFVSRWAVSPFLSGGRLRTIPGLSFSIRRTFQWALPAGALRGSAARFHSIALAHPPSAG